MIFEEDYEELENKIEKDMECWRGFPLTSGVRDHIKTMVMEIIKAQCEKNFAEYDIKLTKKAVK